MQGVILDEVQDFVSVHAELHGVPIAPFLYLVQALNGSPGLQAIDLLLL